jgi:endonuclease-3
MAASLPPPARRIGKILERLEEAYPDARCSLHFTNPLELLVATILSAQCTDALVNTVTAELFKKYKRAADYASAPLATLERDMARVNFFRNKARSIKAACQLLVERFRGQVPARMEDLLQLPGVARKTANVVLGNAFHAEAGVVVDTHVMRLSQRLGLTTQRDRDKIERDLMALVPRKAWTRFGHRMIAHGRAICTAKEPRCPSCPLGKPLCPSYHTSSGPASRVPNPGRGRRPACAAPDTADRLCLPAGRPRTASSTSPMCPSTRTLGKIAAIRPPSSITNVVRSIPRYARP